MFAPVRICLLLLWTSNAFAAIESVSNENLNSMLGASTNETGCHLSSALNALLVKMLVTMQPQLFVQPKHLLLREGSLILPPKEKTTVIITPVVSTVTVRVPKVLSIWFRNERIPTTIFATSTQVITELVTTTSTIGVEPTNLAHSVNKRQVLEVTQLDSSFPEDGDKLVGNFATDFSEDSVSEEFVSQVLSQPNVKDALLNLIIAIQTAVDNFPKNK